jgi:Protein tyrosine and serine/threonine kinase
LWLGFVSDASYLRRRRRHTLSQDGTALKLENYTYLNDGPVSASEPAFDVVFLFRRLQGGNTMDAGDLMLRHGGYNNGTLPSTRGIASNERSSRDNWTLGMIGVAGHDGGSQNPHTFDLAARSPFSCNLASPLDLGTVATRYKNPCPQCHSADADTVDGRPMTVYLEHGNPNALIPSTFFPGRAAMLPLRDRGNPPVGFAARTYFARVLLWLRDLNDAPEISATPHDLGPVLPNTNTAALRVGDLLDAVSYTDADVGFGYCVYRGAAFVGTFGPGTWQYVSAASGGWMDFPGNMSLAWAFTLDEGASIRLNASSTTGQASLLFAGWDGTTVGDTTAGGVERPIDITTRRGGEFSSSAQQGSVMATVAPPPTGLATTGAVTSGAATTGSSGIGTPTSGAATTTGAGGSATTGIGGTATTSGSTGRMAVIPTSPNAVASSTNSGTMFASIFLYVVIAAGACCVIVVVLLWRRRKRTGSSEDLPNSDSLETDDSAVQSSSSDSGTEYGSFVRSAESPGIDPESPINGRFHNLGASWEGSGSSDEYDGLIPDVEGGDTENGGGASVGNATPPSARQKRRDNLRARTLADKHTLEYDEIEFGEELGRGAFGVVFRAEWHEMDVAVKKISSNDGRPLSIFEVEGFLEEAELMMALTPHKNCIQLIGVCTEPLCIVTELAEWGSLQDMLQDSSKKLGRKLRHRIMLDVARGMSHLAQSKVIHKECVIGLLSPPSFSSWPLSCSNNGALLVLLRGTSCSLRT